MPRGSIKTGNYISIAGKVIGKLLYCYTITERNFGFIIFVAVLVWSICHFLANLLQPKVLCIIISEISRASHEYQWFTHDLVKVFFDGSLSDSKVLDLGEYFIESGNPKLISPYSIYFEKEQIREPYKFITGSLERIEEILTWARFVCEGLKREREPDGKIYVSPYMTIHCGTVKDDPAFEHSTEVFMNAVGSLAVKENAPYTVLREGFGRRERSEFFNWERRNKHRIYLNLEEKNKDVPVRDKIAARRHLKNWLLSIKDDGEKLVRIWQL